VKEAFLVLNAGSSSIKFLLFAVAGRDRLEPLIRGQIDDIHTVPRFIARDAEGNTIAERRMTEGVELGYDGALAWLAEFIRREAKGLQLEAVGHRVVHGGPTFVEPVAIDGDVLAALERLIPLAPLHQPHNLAPVRMLLDRQPELPQVACFDTAFHRGHEPSAELFALPYELYEAGVRRYGFHGLSYEYVAAALPEAAPEIAGGRVVVAHLGSGASLCALKGGRSVDSTMGFTALDGLPMGTRSGQLDPGVVLYLMQERAMAPQEVEALLYKKSGLLGISGVSNDMRDLLASKVPRAKLAVDYFVFRVARETAALASALGGLDGIVFTAGIGERSAEIRRRVCESLGWLGVDLDTAANERGGPRLSRDGSKVSAWVVPTNEELMIARHARALLRL
jgi:acetate kinase